MAVLKHKALSVITCLSVAHLLCLLTSQTEAGVSRSKRQGCGDGTYTQNGRECCMCPAGTRVQEHCTGQSQTQCEPCETGREFQSHATQQETCDACTSCAHQNANQVVNRNCTAYVDSTCKCKEKHYCPNGETQCKICEPCQECGPVGEKVACSPTSNTVCNDKPHNDKDNTLGIALGVILPLLAVIAAGVGYFVWKQRKSASETIGPEEPSENVPLEPIYGPALSESLRRNMHAVAEVLPWTDMRNLANISNIPEGRIQSCQKAHQDDSVEATIKLLKVWEEKESENAVTKLIQYLKKNNKNSTAEDVLKILRDGSS